MTTILIPSLAENGRVSGVSGGIWCRRREGARVDACLCVCGATDSCSAFFCLPSRGGADVATKDLAQSQCCGRGGEGERCRRVGPEENKMTKVENARSQQSARSLHLLYLCKSNWVKKEPPPSVYVQYVLYSVV